MLERRRAAGLTAIDVPFNLSASEDDYRPPDGGVFRELNFGVWSSSAALVIEVVSPAGERRSRGDWASPAYRIRYIGAVDPGHMIRERRCANGITQEQLAIRAGSTQAAISRLERGQLSPTFETFERLLAVMGEEAELEVHRIQGDYDLARLRSLRQRSPAERLTLAISWNHLAGRLAREGANARRDQP